MYKGYKVRLFPTPEQEKLLWKHIHACRFLWNYMIDIQEDNYKNGGKYLKAFDMCKKLTEIKNDGVHNWLYEVSNCSLQQICRDLHNSYVLFFENKKRHPKYKSRKNKDYKYPLSQITGKVYFKNGMVTIPVVKKVKYKTNFELPQGRDVKLNNPRISYINRKWILSFGLEFENQEQELNDFSMGIDLGIKELAVVAVNNKKIVFHNINKSKRIKTLEHKKTHIQRVLNRKYRNNSFGCKSNSIKKYEWMLKEINYKLSNIRKEYIHNIIHMLVSMYPKKIVMEDLDLKEMRKNKYLAKQLEKQNLHYFIKWMKYKCEWAGIEFVQADRWFPSSKTCSRCGEIKKDLKLSDRVYKCPCCGLEIDRDYNAAINLMKYESQTERLSA